MTVIPIKTKRNMDSLIPKSMQISSLSRKEVLYKNKPKFLMSKASAVKLSLIKAV